MLPNQIELDLAAERREETVSDVLRDPVDRAGIAPARRVLGRWFMTVGARLAGEPPLRRAEPQFRLARSSRG